VQLGGSQALDTKHLVVVDSICGMDSKPGQWNTQAKLLEFCFLATYTRKLQNYVVGSLYISICGSVRINFLEI
jgi:hypothetical protein